MKADGLPAGTPNEVPTGKRKQLTRTSSRVFDARPPVVGGASICSRLRSEIQLEFAEETRSSTEQDYCRRWPACRMRRQSPQSNFKEDLCDRKDRNQPVRPYRTLPPADRAGPSEILRPRRDRVIVTAPQPKRRAKSDTPAVVLGATSLPSLLPFPRNPASPPRADTPGAGRRRTAQRARTPFRALSRMLACSVISLSARPPWPLPFRSA